MTIKGQILTKLSFWTIFSKEPISRDSPLSQFFWWHHFRKPDGCLDAGKHSLHSWGPCPDFSHP